MAQSFSKEEIARWEQQAQQVTIIRDNWGIPHIYGKTDADAVFGLMYAQCEDDFQRVEMNYIEKLGRLAEVKGESKLTDDLLIRLLIDSAAAKADYKVAPDWLKKLLNAHADGINYYLYKNPQVQPLLLNRFQPWFHLLWTDGSIGAISTADISSREVKNLYLEKDSLTIIPLAKEENPSGSNGFAFAPSITASHHAILYINPHVTFYFRPEVHVVSEEGLNAYGAVTWGQFFVYQGFNEHCGWMHTSSYVDVADTYIEKIHSNHGKWYYEYERLQKPIRQKQITLCYLKGNQIKEKTIRAAYTGHGPVMAKRNGAYLSLKSNNRSMTSLIQSWKRTKTKSFAEYKEVMNLLANTSNNTVYADAEGNIAYWHGNFIPIRDTTYDWSKPVDGTTKATEWNGLHSVDASVHLYNPSNGWIQNCNSTPFTCAGKNSPKKENYPSYFAPDGENFRGINAVRVLEQQQKPHTLNTVIAAGYDTYMPAFELMIPALVSAFEKSILPADSLYTLLLEPIAVLKTWDYHCNEQSVATTLAIHWAEQLSPAIALTAIPDPYNLNTVEKTKRYLSTASPVDLLKAFSTTVLQLKTTFGSWQVAWGDINRYQRLSGQLDLQYKDDEKSIPVGFASSAWGTLPSYRSQVYPGTKKRYGYNGNSFICVVEFGEKIKARSLLAGGESGSPASPHFNDQAEMFSRGEFKDVLFYKEDVLKQAVKTFHPGQE
ncbi:MAG TPA: penicillin acylase family protein [Bacteroidia bacterium]|jgi:acyl-homoserine lactone acylase PvdQ|nr:penicillin acylase family protein [Bacteroidia bacterium]